MEVQQSVSKEMPSRPWIQGWLAGLVLLASAVPAARAQQWALDMFPHTEHDFGTVARGAKVEHRFSFENIYVEDAHVASARVSCGCTTPEVPTKVLRTWDKAEVVAKVDTRSFEGQKDVTITVVFDRPFPAEVQLHIHCYIRTDVVVQPGVVQLGAVPPGAGAKQRVSISYAGQNGWRIVGVETGNPSLSAQAFETGRGSGLVNYDLLVSLAPGAPAGYIRDEIHLVTNDANPRTARVPVPVEGVVRAAVTAFPSPLYLGTVETGKSAVRQIVVSGGTPFRILRIDSTDPRFRCVPDAAVGTLHRLPVTFQAGQTPGKAAAKILIWTDAGMIPLEVPVQADMTPPVVQDDGGADGPPAALGQPATTARPSLGVGREL
jgi:hypothetical protein